MSRRLLIFYSCVAVLGCGNTNTQATSDTSPAPEDTAVAVDTTPAPEDTFTFPDPFTIPVFDKDRITSDSSQPNFHNIYGDFDWGEGPFTEAKLVVDLDTTCYPFEKWQNNPPPSGHNWPADCDAFDRNFEFTMDDPQSDGDPPAVELVRAITPFGGPLHLEIDVTDIANGLPGSHRLKSHITTWSDGSGRVSGSNGGWNVSARFEITPGPAPREVTAVIPVYNGNVRANTELENYGVTLPPGTATTRIEYRVTGHGGGEIDSACIGPADEFCQRNHILRVGSQTLDVVPWRDDCATLCTRATAPAFLGGFEYCVENPCGAIRSVEASRANWCPGSMTPPVVWEPEGVGVGPHTLSFDIQDIGQGGSWRTSLLVIGYANTP